MSGVTANWPMDPVFVGSSTSKSPPGVNSSRALEQYNASPIVKPMTQTPEQSIETYNQLVERMQRLYGASVVYNTLTSTPYFARFFVMSQVDFVVAAQREYVIMGDHVPDPMAAMGLPSTMDYRRLVVPTTSRFDGKAFNMDARNARNPEANEILKGQLARLNNVLVISSEICSNDAFRNSGCRFDEVFFDRTSSDRSLLGVFTRFHSVVGCLNRKDPTDGMNSILALAKENIIGDPSLIVMDKQALQCVLRCEYLTKYNESGPGALDRKKSATSVDRYRWGDVDIMPSVVRSLKNEARQYDPLLNNIVSGAYILIPAIRDSPPDARYHTSVMHGVQFLEYSAGSSTWREVRSKHLVSADQYYPKGQLNRVALKYIADNAQTLLQARSQNAFVDHETGERVIDPYLYEHNNAFSIAEFLGDVPNALMRSDALFNHVRVCAAELERESGDISGIINRAMAALDRNASCNLIEGRITPIEVMAGLITSGTRSPPAINEAGFAVPADQVRRNEFGSHNLPILGAGRRLRYFVGGDEATVLIPDGVFPGFSNASGAMYIASLEDDDSAVARSWKASPGHAATIKTLHDFMIVVERIRSRLSSMFDGQNNRLFNDPSVVPFYTRPENLNSVNRSLIAIIQAMLPLRLPICAMTDIVAVANEQNAENSLGDDIPASVRGAAAVILGTPLNLKGYDRAGEPIQATAWRIIDLVPEPTKDMLAEGSYSRSEAVQKTYNILFGMLSLKTVTDESEFNRIVETIARVIADLLRKATTSDVFESDENLQNWITATLALVQEAIKLDPKTIYNHRGRMIRLETRQTSLTSMSSGDDTGSPVRDFRMVNLSVDRSTWQSIHRTSRIQPCNPADPISEMRRFSTDPIDPGFSSEDLRVIRRDGRGRVGTSNNRSQYRQNNYSFVEDVEAAASKHGPYGDHCIGPMARPNSPNYQRRLKLLESNMTHLQRLALCMLLGVNVNVDTFFRNAEASYIPVVKDLILEFPNVMFQTHDAFVGRDECGSFEYTKPNLRRVVQENMDEHWFVDWTSRATVNPTTALVIPSCFINGVVAGKNTTLVQAGATKNSGSVSGPARRMYDITKNRVATASKESGLVFTVGFGSPIVPEMYCISGRLPVNVPGLTLSQQDQELERTCTPGTLFQDYVTGASMAPVDGQLGTFTAMLQMSDRHAARPGFVMTACDAKRYNPSTGVWVNHCEGVGIFLGEEERSNYFNRVL
ncbi:MAG: hypothetical protein JSS82_14060 [Bacteroidetes bacterium]|nr:hypothetical protein [Bacteroidota bacterium]